MKELIKAILIWVIFSIIIFFAGSFVANSLDPSEWDMAGRLFVSFVFICSLIFFLINKEEL